MLDKLIRLLFGGVGIYHRVVVPIGLASIGLLLLIGSIENLSGPKVSGQGRWITFIVVGSLLVAGSVWLFVLANMRNRRFTVTDSGSREESTGRSDKK
jgi:hypothetical protein